MPVAGRGEHWAMREAVFTICAVSTGLNCQKSREKSHIPVDDATKGQNRSLGSVRKFAVLTERKKL